MRKTLVCAAAAAYLGMAGSAVAGGMYEGEGSMKDAPAPLPPVHIWAGLYVGGTVGFGTGDTSGKLDINVERRRYENDNGHTPSLSEVYVGENGHMMEMVKRPNGGGGNADGLIGAIEDLLATEYDVDGAVYGAFVGYNWQRGNIVYGLEAGLNGTDFDGHTDCGFIKLSDCNRELSYYGTVVGRLGYAVNNFLFYGFGGVAWGEVETDVSIAGFDLDALSRDTTHVGWTAGVGLETALTHNFIVGIEYAHVDLGEEDYSIYSGDVKGYGIDIDNKVDMDFDVIKFRAAYKFGDRHEPLESFK
jgi:outer membrane immunogenic protein